MKEQYIKIGDAAKKMEVSVDTLRRWDKSGKLKATITSGGHRVYKIEDIDIFLNDIPSVAYEWARAKKPSDPPSHLYNQTKAIFEARLSKMQNELEKDSAVKNFFSLLVSVAGEIGNNSFDHNLGNWPDIPGILFGFDLKKKQIVLADRGNGILQTLKRVRPSLETHSEALQVAFTEVISGREPEARGNGLKYVRQITQGYPISLVFQTGDAVLNLKENQKDLKIITTPKKIQGCLVIITF